HGGERGQSGADRHDALRGVGREPRPRHRLAAGRHPGPGPDRFRDPRGSRRQQRLHHRYRASPTSLTLRRSLPWSSRMPPATLAGPYLDALRARGIPVIVLKGGVLAERYYQRSDDRPMHDVDLLLRPGDVEKALALAADVGLQRFDDAHTLDFDLRFDTKTVLTHHPHDLRQPSLDLHWALVRDWLDARGNAWLETAWQRPEPATFAGR